MYIQNTGFRLVILILTKNFLFLVINFDINYIQR